MKKSGLQENDSTARGCTFGCHATPGICLPRATLASEQSSVPSWQPHSISSVAPAACGHGR
jgi:hypothetical protein